MSEKKSHSLIVVVVLIAGLLGIILPEQIKSLYDWEITVFIISPLCFVATWAIVKASKEKESDQ